jgi:hypothetical protein
LAITEEYIRGEKFSWIG